MSSQVVAFSHPWDHRKNKLKPDFEWSLSPLLVLLRCFGVPLDFQSPKGPTKNRHLCSWWFITCMGLFSFFLNVEHHFIIIGQEIVAASKLTVGQKSTSVYNWNRYIELTMIITALMGTHCMLVVLAHKNWRHLSLILHSMEEHIYYTDQDYKRFRLACIAGATAIVLEILFWMIQMVLWWPDPNRSSIVKQLQHVGDHFFPIYLFCSIFLFGSLGWIAYSMLNILCNRIQEDDEVNNKQRQPNSPEVWRRRLVAWKAQYYWIGEYVHSINGCFGSLLLLVITGYFVRMVNNSFVLLNAFRFWHHEDNEIVGCLFVFYIVKDFIYFIAIVYLPYVIRQEAIVVNKKLDKLDFDETNLRNQVAYLKMEISLFLPQISAAGFFDIDCQLIPSFVGTTLTYLIILYQFDSQQEKSTIHSK